MNALEGPLESPRDGAPLAATVLPDIDAGEAALLDALRRGDPDAYEELLRLYGGRMLAVARRLLRHEEDARDAVQEAFLLAFRGLPSFGERCRLGTWLHRIVVNAALMKIRHRERKPETAIDDLLPEYQPDGHHVTQYDEWRLPAPQRILREEVRTRVHAAIDQLPETYRTVLLLRDIDEMDTPEVAALLGITPNAVKIRLHRARQALRTLLDPVFATSAR